MSDSTTTTENPFAALLAAVAAKAAKRAKAEKTRTGRERLRSDFRVGEAHKRATLRQLGTLGSLEYLARDRPEEHEEAIRDFLLRMVANPKHTFASTGETLSLTPHDLAALVRAVNEGGWDTVATLALAFGEEPKEGQTIQMIASRIKREEAEARKSATTSKPEKDD